MPHGLNTRIADRLREMAGVLKLQGENGFRSEAYRRAADIVEHLSRPVDEILSAEGREGLVALPAVGQGIASAIAEMVTTGRWTAFDRLTEGLDPEALLMTIPGIGPRLAQRLHTELHIDTLEELEQAIVDRKLEQLGGFGQRKLDAIRGALRDRLRLLRGRFKPDKAPSVETILAVDEEYRRKAARNELKLIAPRRFNPQRLAWLPVLHSHRPPWHFTAMFSNTARAHQLNKARNWVMVFASHDRGPDWQGTIVTETRGPSKGKRVVRGREMECETHYLGRTIA